MGNNPEPPRPGDRHRERFLVRLPEIFRSKLRILRDRTQQPMTALIRMAVKLLLRAHGLWSKKDDQELRRQEQTDTPKKE
jgi:hypothetical protein